MQTYIVQHNAHKNIERNAEEVHDGAPGLLRNVLGPHFHNGRPEYSHTSLKSTEASNLNTACKWDHQKLQHKQLFSFSTKTRIDIYNYMQDQFIIHLDYHNDEDAIMKSNIADIIVRLTSFGWTKESNKK